MGEALRGRRSVLLATLLVVGTLIPASAGAAVAGESVDYNAGDTLLKGYLFVEQGVGSPRPGVLVVHEWWGHNAYARRRARMLAEAGYAALAVDMYGDGRTAEHPDDAKRFATKLRRDLPLARSRFRAALDVLRTDPRVDPRRIAAIGYCFGGGIVLQMARDGMDLKGVVSFHGGLATAAPAQTGSVKARVLVFTGGEDPIIPPTQVEAFRTEMTTAGADFQVKIFPGVKHSFTNPDADRYAERFDLPLAYDEAADKASWAEASAFLREIFTNR